MRRRDPGEVQAGQLHPILDGLLPDLGQVRMRVVDRSDRRRAGLDVGEPFLDRRLRARDVDVAGDDEARVPRLVVGLEEVDDILVAGGRQVLHVADGRPAVGMALRIEHLGDLDRRHAVGRVLVALPALVLDDVALGVDGLGRHRVDQVGHAIRFEEERQIQRVRRDIDVVVGAVLGRRGVVGAAGRFQQLVEVAVLRVGRAHEHEVLEQVGEPGPSRLLARRADVIPDVHRDHGHCMVFVQDHVQSVRQRELRIRDVQARGCRRYGGQRNQQAGQQEAKRELPHC